MKIRIAGALFCALLLSAVTGEAFAENAAIGAVATTRLKTQGNGGASRQDAAIITSRSNKKHTFIGNGGNGPQDAAIITSRSNKKKQRW